MWPYQCLRIQHGASVTAAVASASLPVNYRLPRAEKLIEIDTHSMLIFSQPLLEVLTLPTTRNMVSNSLWATASQPSYDSIHFWYIIRCRIYINCANAFLVYLSRFSLIPSSFFFRCSEESDLTYTCICSLIVVQLFLQCMALHVSNALWQPTKPTVCTN